MNMIIRNAIMNEKNPPIPKKYPMVTPSVNPRLFTAFKNACPQHHSPTKHPAMTIPCFISIACSKVVDKSIAIRDKGVARYPMIV